MLKPGHILLVNLTKMKFEISFLFISFKEI